MANTSSIAFGQTLNWKLRNFSQESYSLDPGGHLWKLMQVLLGPAGTGQFHQIVTAARQSEQIDQVEFSELDYILGDLFFSPRLASEQYGDPTVNPFLAQLPKATWDNITITDSSYRERLKAICQAVERCPTVFGIEQIAEAMFGVACRVLETWRVSNGSALGARTGSLFEFVVIPQSPSPISRDVIIAAYNVIQNVKPVGSVCTILPCNTISIPSGSVVPPPPNVSVSINRISASGSWFEFQRMAMGVVSPPPTTAANNGVISSRYWVSPNTLLEAPTFAHLQVQENTIDVTQNISAVTIPNPTTSGQLYSTNYTPWIPIATADSPDNYPPPNAGQYPADPAHLAPEPYTIIVNGIQYTTNYIYSWPSQAAYIEYFTGIITTLGGQVQNNTYRLPISFSGSPLPSNANISNILSPAAPTISSTIYGAQ